MSLSERIVRVKQGSLEDEGASLAPAAMS